ncbi:LysR family transcriptional regulator [Parvularcula sp. IMCC14364]|uniref:LysR family transcriptional regulator n=1 Tax=Parvularcula sp. IMCC14364 TaxID=3067902 RepID=UPI002740E9FD|nr:LysR family transcriptional regulator [Parvularcula sp. IMCC14364]
MDLNLLLVFDAVMRERNVTRAADTIGLSQPAVSNALSRLRHHLKDELFLRSPEGMKATPRALELAEPVRTALHNLEEVLDPPQFDPATSDRSFKLAAVDYATSVILPRIVDQLTERAPGINLRMLPPDEALEALDSHNADFALIPMPNPPERFEFETLGGETFVLLMRAGHPLASGKLTLERFVSYPHLLVSVRGEATGFVDDALKEHGLTRRVAMTVPQFSMTPQILAATDMVLTVPKGLADTYGPAYNLVQRPALVTGPAQFGTLQLIWHRRLASHPAYHWFRQTFLELVRTTRNAQSSKQKP